MSIRLRLALWYGALTGLVVLLVTVLTYATHSRAHYDDLDATLVAAGRHVAEELAATAPARGAETVLAVPVGPGLAARLHGPDGAVLAAAPNAAVAPAADPRAVLAQGSPRPFDAVVGLAPPLARVDPGAGAFGLVAAPDGSRWRAYGLPTGSGGETVVVLAPLARVDASVGRFRQLIPFLAGTGGIVSLFVGLLLAGRALRPIAVLTQTAGDIARSRGFSRRVPIARDRDELGRLAATFNGMLASLEEAYQAQQRFVADASHELRAPLTAIQANLELLERRPDMAAAGREEAVAEASREARRLTRLVSDLLALARADAGVAVRHEQVELDRVVLDALSQVQHLARGQRLEVGDLEPTVVEGDADRLKQLLVILLDNAVKYTPAGGLVTLGVRRDGRGAELMVRDSGIGIAPEDLVHVFERFYRADRARTRDPGGSGLGLSIARWIAEQHRGAITLDSEPNRGTSVTVRLPGAA